MKNKTYASIACCLSLLSYGIIISSFGPALSLMGKDFGLNSAEISSLFMFISFGLISGVFFSWFLIKKISINKLARIGQSIIALALFLLFYSNKFYLVNTACFFIGMSGGIIQISSNTIISEIYHKKRASMLSLLHFFFGLGALLGPFMMGFIIDRNANWRTSFLIIACYSFVVSIGMLFNKYKILAHPNEKQNIKLKSILLNNLIIIISICIVVYVGIEMAINSWVPTYIQSNYKVSALLSGSIVTFFWISMTIGRLICAYLTRIFSISIMLLIFSISGFVGYVLFLGFNNYYISIASIVLIGFSFSGVYPILLALGANRFPNNIRQLNMVFLVFTALGFMLLPMFIGVFAQIYSLNTSMILISSFFILFIVLALILKKTA